MNQYVIDNIKSTFFGLNCYEIEQYKSETHNEVWVKVVFDYPCNGSFKEVHSWFKASELTLV